jgi:thioredoxin 1
MSNIGRILIGVLLVVAVAAVILLKTQQGATTGAAGEKSQQLAPPGTAETGKSAPLPRLVDLGSTTCIPCKLMAPILEELRSEYAGCLEVEVLDVRRDASLAPLYNVRVIPTQIFFSAAGQELYRHEGFMSKADILTKWGALGVALKPVE